MRLCVLGSGSSGNVAFVEAGPAAAPTRVLVDAGLGKRDLEQRLASITDESGRALTLADIHAILVTHDHRDHVGCAKKLGPPVFAPAATLRAEGIEGTRVLAGSRFSVGALRVHPVLLPHDADETVGYVLSDDDVRVGILTDCGCDDPRVAEDFAGCHTLVLETNHDRGLLESGLYPPSLKRRVGGRRGHLSNDQAASLLRMMLRHGPMPERIIAAHLSQANNRPQLARRALQRVVERGAEIEIAHQDHPTAVFRVGARRQLALSFDGQRSPAEATS